LLAEKGDWARLHVLEGSGHCVDVEKPKGLAALIAEFIGGS